MPICPRSPRIRRFPFRGFLGRWFLANTVVSGVLALVWLVLRCGAKPSRIAYPCQRAAMSTAALAFGAPLVAVILAARRRVTLWMRAPAILAAAVLGLALTVSLSIYYSRATEYGGAAYNGIEHNGIEYNGTEYSGAALRAPVTYRAQLFHVLGCPQDPGGDHFVGLSNLLGVMGRGGLKFYRSGTVAPAAGPDGIIAADDVVVIKINYQWDQRGGTNTDLLRGLIRAILDHPDGFSGEVVVCENAQFNAVSNFDRALNNAQDHSLSPHDVVAGFQSGGYHVSHYDWTLKRSIQVGEYSAGDLVDGYVIGPYNSQWQGKLSYPKFRSVDGTYISLRYGTWDPGSGTYDRSRLKFINVPVLKSHHATYGATASTKHYMGVVTDQFATNSHSGIRFGIMGALMDEIQIADLNIIDAVWINANPSTGPQTTYNGATRRDELVACLDPIALDRWSVKNILIPAFVANGYSPPWPSPSADPDLATGSFRTYLDASMNRLLATGHLVTNDYAQIDAHNGNGAGGDFDHNGTVDQADYAHFAACYTGPGGGPVGPDCTAGDFDSDGDVDCDDWQYFKLVWTGAGAVPALPACDVESAPAGGSGPRAVLARPSPNPMETATDIAYTLAIAGHVRLAIFDARGRVVRVLRDGDEIAGGNTVRWNGRDDAGERVGRGVYWCRLEAGGGVASERVVVR